MKIRLLSALALLGVLIIVVSAFWYAQSCIPQPTPTSTPESNPTVTSAPSTPTLAATVYPVRVKIIDFSMIDEIWSPVCGLVCDCRFNLTIKNEGISNLTGLQLTVKLLNNGNEVTVGNYIGCAFENRTLADTLHSGEARDCSGTLMCTVGDSAYCYGFETGQRAIVVCWDSSGERYRSLECAPDVQVHDIMGRAIASRPVPLTESPVYLTGPAGSAAKTLSSLAVAP